jgi:hypothetical protein
VPYIYLAIRRPGLLPDIFADGGVIDDERDAEVCAGGWDIFVPRVLLLGVMDVLA